MGQSPPNHTLLLYPHKLLVDSIRTLKYISVTPRLANSQWSDGLYRGLRPRHSSPGATSELAAPAFWGDRAPPREHQPTSFAHLTGLTEHLDRTETQLHTCSGCSSDPQRWTADLITREARPRQCPSPLLCRPLAVDRVSSLSHAAFYPDNCHACLGNPMPRSR